MPVLPSDSEQLRDRIRSLELEIAQLKLDAFQAAHHEAPTPEPVLGLDRPNFSIIVLPSPPELENAIYVSARF